MRPECHGVVRYFQSLLPVPQFDYSADKLFGLDGTEIFEKVWAMEILSIYMQAPETRVDVNEEIDIICPSWIAEKFISQLLPHATPRRVANRVVDFPTPVEVCAWFEDVEMCSRIMAREIEAYVQDLPNICRFNESLHQDILQTYFSVSKEFECFKLGSCIKQQVQYAIEPGPYAIPLARDIACKKESTVIETLLRDVVSNTETAKSVKVFEIKPSDQDSLREQCADQIGHKKLENYTETIDIQNLVERVEISEGEEPITELIDFDPADFLLEKLHIRGNVVPHIHQSASYVVDSLSFLHENSVAADISIVTRNVAMKYTAKVMFELPEVLEDGNLNSFLTWELGTYVSTLIDPNPIELEDSDSQKNDFQDFDKLVIFPELTLEAPRFHFLQVPSFISEHQERIPIDVFQVLFRAKALPSSTSASDWVYLDWHLSQVGHCNNYGCFHLQRRLMENELSVTLQRDVILGKRMPDHLLLVSIAEESLLWHHVEIECGNKVYPAAYSHASAPTSSLNFSSFLRTPQEAADKSLPDQSTLTRKLKNNFCSTRDQPPLPGSGSTSMDTVLSLMKQARQGDLSTDTKLMQVSENEFYHEGYQGIGNIKYKVHDQTPEEYQVLGSALTSVKVSKPTPPPSSHIDAPLSYNLQSPDHVEPQLQVHLSTPACPSTELPETGIEPAPPMQPVYEELTLRQSKVEDFIQLSSGQRQEQGPHLIIVANILQPSGSIFLQRRSSYQKILGLENEDLQVVERELKFPVDLILNPSTCLTVYTEGRLLKYAKSHSPNSQEFFSCVMDMIVESHMKALSFSFQRWFMIFEGELAFNSAIIHILDKLNVCSAGFQMHVQGFLSTNPTATDYLVLRCIKKIWKMSKRPFDSSMSEDLTDGEIFLATFPSLNPLSSHVILCLNDTLATFISWSREEQKCALQDFSVRAESLNLLAAQVLYGKLKISAHRGFFSECPWPAASEIVAPEVERPVQTGFSYFPPASEISGCKFEEDSDGVSPREGHGDLYPPSCPLVPNDSAEQGFFDWNGVCWPNDDETTTFPNNANARIQQPTFRQENYVCCNPADVHGILQQWIQSRKGGDRDTHHTEAETESYWDSFKVPNNGLYRARPACVNAPSPSYKNHANDELRWTPLLKTSGKRPISALEQFRHQRGVSPALRSRNKMMKPAAPSNRSRDNGPTSQLDHSLKISRQSCFKFNSPLDAQFDQLPMFPGSSAPQ